MEEKTYAVFTAESVNAMAEACGLSPVPHEAAASLGEDASYRLRQVTMLATQYIKHSKRRRLSVDDFNKAVKELSLMPMCGHGSQEPTTFRQVKDLDMHCVDDPEVNLCDIALGNSIPKNIGLPSIKAHWLAVEGTIKIWSGSSSASQGKGSREMSQTHLNYYNCMTRALLSQKAEEKKKALRDLKTNPNIVPLLPYLVNFVICGIKNMSHDMAHLTTMLNAIRALLHNRSLYLMHKPYLTTIVQGVEFCVLEPLAASISSSNDQWVLRDYAARLLAEIVNRWNSPQNHLRYHTIKCLREVLYDTSKPFYSHYGAIMAFIALGHKTLEDIVLPHLPNYWPHLRAAMEDLARERIVTRCDSHKVYGALRLAAEKVLSHHIRKFQDLSAAVRERREVSQLLDNGDNEVSTSPSSSTSDVDTKKSGDKNFSKLYKELYEYFGDSLAHCLPLVETQDVFRAVARDDLVSLGDANTGKSGEELLENLMEQIQRQEKLEQERKERERQERKEREKLERQRQAREAILRKKREEEERVKRLKREEDEKRRRRYEEEADQQRRVREEEDRRQKEWEEQIKELNKNRNKPEWQQEIELRRIQLEEEMQYSRKMEAKKRQEGLAKAEEEQRLKKLKAGELQKVREEEEEQAGRSRAGLRRRKPVNYTEKDEDISDLFEENSLTVPRPLPRLNPAFPPHSDISDYSDEDMKRLAGSPAEGLAVSKVIDPSKGLLKLKIKRQPTHSSTPPHPMSATPQHTPSSYHSPSMQSPMYSPLSGSHSTPPPPPLSSSIHHRSKSSSGSEKESKHKKGSTSSRQSRGGSMGFQDISDPEETFYEKPLGSLPPQLYSPGGESSGSDSNPHRKALKLKLKLTPKESASEGDN